MFMQHQQGWIDVSLEEEEVNMTPSDLTRSDPETNQNGTKRYVKIQFNFVYINKKVYLILMMLYCMLQLFHFSCSYNLACYLMIYSNTALLHVLLA